MLKFHQNKRLLVGFLLAFAVVTWLALHSYMSTRRLIATSNGIADTHNVLFHAERLLALAVNIETGQRGFSLTGDDEFLEPYDRGIEQIRPHFKALSDLAGRHGNEQERLRYLAGDIDTLVRFSTSVVDARKRNVEEALALNATLEGKTILDRMRKSITELEAREKRLLGDLIADNEQQIANFNYSFIALLFVASSILLGLLFAVNVNFKRGIETEKRLISASEEIQDLYDNAPCGYHSLNDEGIFVEINKTLLKWLGYESRQQVIGKLKFEDIINDDDLKSFSENYPSYKQNGFVKNVELSFKRRNGTEFPVVLSSVAVYDEKGKFLKSRSNTFDNTKRKQAERQVTNLNRELEAFTYSVSHDLRAPLRSIDGYTRMLYEDYEEKIDAEGRRLMSVILTNARRMGKLMDDLLEFSRLSRKDLQMSGIEMTSLVNTIITDQVARERGRQIAVTVHHLHPGFGDIDMIRQVWVNLVSNAIKYTGKAQDPAIEIGSREEGGEVQYFISDNGAGFDMQYAGKLFGVFQRLHRAQDFPGTGVGLAIVKKIISKHGGRVWGEGKVDRGATFYFTIPNNNGK
jgi:PAS domain S-box-containing protein